MHIGLFTPTKLHTNKALSLASHTLCKERKGLGMLQPLICRHNRNLLWPMRSSLLVDCIRYQGVALCQSVFSKCQHLIYVTTLFDHCIPRWQLVSCSVTRPFLYLRRVWLVRLQGTQPCSLHSLPHTRQHCMPCSSTTKVHNITDSFCIEDRPHLPFSAVTHNMTSPCTLIMHYTSMQHYAPHCLPQPSYHTNKKHKTYLAKWHVQDIGMVWKYCGVLPIKFGWCLRVPSLIFIQKTFFGTLIIVISDFSVSTTTLSIYSQSKLLSYQISSLFIILHGKSIQTVPTLPVIT